MAEKRYTPDEENLIDLREHVHVMRTEKGYFIDPCETAPLDFPGVDDVANRFQWWRVADADKELIGYFYTPKGFEL